MCVNARSTIETNNLFFFWCSEEPMWKILAIKLELAFRRQNFSVNFSAQNTIDQTQTEILHASTEGRVYFFIEDGVKL